ncbi:cytochrome b6-f complex subunit PetN [Streptomyces sp. NPDC002896]
MFSSSLSLVSWGRTGAG